MILYKQLFCFIPYLLALSLVKENFHEGSHYYFTPLLDSNASLSFPHISTTNLIM